MESKNKQKNVEKNEIKNKAEVSEALKKPEEVSAETARNYTFIFRDEA